MYEAAWWAMSFQVMQFAAIILSAVLRLGMLQTSMLFAFSQIVIYAASALYVRRALPAYFPWLRGAKARTGLNDLGHSTILTASNIVQQSTTNGAVLLVSALAGPVSVPVFTTVRTLTNLWTAVTGILTAPLLPEVVRIHAHGETPKLAAINQAFWVLAGTTVNLGALLLYPLMPLLYRQWTAHAVVLNAPLLALLLAGVVVTNSGALIALYLNGINKLHIALGTSVARALLGLGGGALGFPFLGIVSFGFGILAGEIVAVAMMGRYFVRQLAEKGLHMQGAALAAVTLSTGATVLFFVGAALGWWTIGAWWFAALACVAGAAIWGWKGLDTAIKTRLLSLITSWRPLA
jgi:O-antigen/teichoic acid export membrane protein